MPPVKSGSRRDASAGRTILSLPLLRVCFFRAGLLLFRCGSARGPRGAGIYSEPVRLLVTGSREGGIPTRALWNGPDDASWLHSDWSARCTLF